MMSIVEGQQLRCEMKSHGKVTQAAKENESNNLVQLQIFSTREMRAPVVC